MSLAKEQDPDPSQNVMDPEHLKAKCHLKNLPVKAFGTKSSGST
jgi:hypothetical protein